ncbi:5-formyltetrahydrofolate cyclo-ligase [Pyrodictium abyssi]|uniref:5-formyltetrahydrofolate cyclo-ligase n=1 Tax=Pyrodictium abyssi TaxID=54256 RepID=A0ABN6ZQW9_9CREN|nr:5-formyltetrahydrofolate cyclo-ligase [Pyrodictium abyssi]
MSGSSREKQRIREQIWRLLEERGVAAFPRPVYGRIPNFKGAEEAAARLAETPEWRRARIIKANPDAPQKWVRLAALRSGKTLVMATPRLREGFLLLDPRFIPGYLYEKAATIRGAFQLGKKLSIDELRSMGGIDLIVTGSVAVDRRGHRVGKGEGYAEIEYGIMRELGLVGEDTPIATTIHDLQLVEHIPREPYDLAVDIAATPRKLLRFEGAEKPPGIIWSMLPCKKFREILVLQELARIRGVDKPCRD